MQTVINDILTNYQIYGDTNKKTVLILHGWGQSLLDWTDVSKQLSLKNRILVVDLPGFGSSSTPPFPYGVDDFVNFVINFTKKVNLKDFILIGHSMGGKIAIKLASKNILGIDKLILISPSGISEKTFFIKFKILFYKIIKPFTKIIGQNLKNKIINLVASEDYLNSGLLIDTFKKFVNDYVFEDAKNISIPTLVIWGENDSEIPLINAKKLRSTIKISTLRIVWKTGHSPNIEAPNKLSEIILEYL